MPLFLGKVFRQTTRIALTCSLALAAGCAPARADETWRCSTSNGHYDELPFRIPAKITSVSGRMIFHTADFKPEWNSLARVSLTQSSSDGRPCNCSGIVAFAFPDPNLAEFYMSANGKDEAMARGGFEKSVSFKITVDSQGLMTVAIGEIDPVIKSTTLLHPDYDGLLLLCSGADVSFMDVMMQ